MKKLALGLAILFAVFACAGCAPKKEESVVGRWLATIDGNDFLFEFNEDGTLGMSSFGININGFYEIEGEKITLTLFGESDVGTFSFEDGKLILIDSKGTELILEKESLKQ